MCEGSMGHVLLFISIPGKGGCLVSENFLPCAEVRFRNNLKLWVMSPPNLNSPVWSVSCMWNPQWVCPLFQFGVSKWDRPRGGGRRELCGRSDLFLLETAAKSLSAEFLPELIQVRKVRRFYSSCLGCFTEEGKTSVLTSRVQEEGLWWLWSVP